jgi:phosphoenolpyruvate-protein kinase (PTS system EI component)
MELVCDTLFQLELLQLPDGTPIIMDTESASIYIQPSEEVIRQFRSQRQSLLDTQALSQYMLAVDRTNAKVAEYYQPYHPAVARSFARIVSAARYRKKEISVCSELAHDQKYIPFLLGIGIRALSVYPKFLPSVQKTICNLKFSDAKFYAEQLLAKNSL